MNRVYTDEDNAPMSDDIWYWLLHNTEIEEGGLSNDDGRLSPRRDRE